MASLSSHSSGVQSVPLDTFSGRHRTLGYAVNGIPLPTQPYLATAPIVQGSTIDTGKHFTLFFSSPDSQTLALLSSGTIATLQFLLADGRAPSAKVQITSSLSGSTLLVDVLVLSDASTATANLPFVLLQQDGSTRMTQVFGEIPEDIKDKPLLGLYDPVTHSAVAAQAGTTVTDNTNSVVYAPLAGSGGGGGGGAVTIADGADANAGATTNTAVTGDNTGTISAKLRGLNKAIADFWDSTNHWLQVKVMNANSLGQQLTVASTSIVPASDSPNFPIKRNGVALYSLASTLENASGNSGDLNVAAYTEIGIDITTTAHAGTSPTVQFFWNRKGADGLYYPLWQSAVFSAAANTLSTSIGAGMAYAQSLGLTGQLSWVIGGSASPSVTFSANVYGK